MFYGWKVVGAILVVLTFSSGLSFYNHAVILDALARRPGFSVESVSIAVSLFFISGGITGLWVGKLLNRYDIRWCMTVGAVVSGISLTALARVDSLLELCLVYICFGAGFSASGILPGTTLVARWFQRKRAMALSVASTGLSLGGIVITPASAALMESVGLSITAPILGLVYILGVVPVTWMYLKESPASMGMGVDGTPPTSESESNRQIDGVSWSRARRHRFFWGASLAYIFLMMAQVGGIAHQYGLVSEIVDNKSAALALAILPVASIVGRLIGGWLVDNMSIRSFALAMIVLQVVALSVLGFSAGVAALFVGLALFGVTVGNLLMLQSLLVAEAFGLRDYSRIFSATNLMSSLGTACGPAVLGLVYAASGSYWEAYGVAALAGLVGLLLFVSAGPVSAARQADSFASPQAAPYKPNG
ncbi:MFS transporter [Gilvimarinus sp. F26214L]|uniref:MFS transporter n=1 Tax=Gilvimarinus sp. DZF01 TaxID=3461371 RepID=UPI004045AFB3